MENNRENENVGDMILQDMQNSCNHRNWAKSISERYGVSDEDSAKLYCYIRDMYVNEYTAEEFGRMSRRLEKIENSRLRFGFDMMRCRMRIFIDGLFEDSWLQRAYYWLYRLGYSNITLRLYERRMRRQRAKRGYSDSDWQNIDLWLSEVLADAIEHLADNTISTPGQIEAIMKGKSPTARSGASDGEVTEKEWRRRHKWWVNHLRKIAFCLRESNEETCSRQNDIKIDSSFRWKRIDKWPYYYEMTRDDSPECMKREAEYMKKERALARYRRNQFKKALLMLSELHGMLWD